MSGLLTDDGREPDGPDDRAGLYVLGVLEASDMRDVRAQADRDPGLAGEIARWEQRLAPLAQLAPPAEPPAGLWERIETRLSELAGPAGTPVRTAALPWERTPARRAPPSWRALNIWRGVALGTGALAAALAGLLVLQTVRPERLAVILPAKGDSSGWLAQLQPNGSIIVHVVGTIARPEGRDLELWALAEGASQPVALGLMPRDAARVLKPGTLPTANMKLLVSSEPLGGSPTGLPTGAVVYAGAIVTN